MQQAEKLYLQALAKNPASQRPHFHLARLYVAMDRRDEAVAHFDRAIEAEQESFLKEFMSGMKLMDLYPHDPQRRQQARQHMENALQIQPRSQLAREALEVLGD